ncbi:unnamed protein product [Miscanthus lutarioriparius]|uniref:NB-ARC domain-containing protein n=1 Tax=Miscanthus lutarioriparius TaxID=422564 RepID=A0A811QB02_9POAL|nr:unnamed protein product [Miscanthus lutarioriparius]
MRRDEAGRGGRAGSAPEDRRNATQESASTRFLSWTTTATASRESGGTREESATELERRLHELQHLRDRERFEALESAPRRVLRKLTEKEMEAQLWQDTATLALGSGKSTLAQYVCNYEKHKGQHFDSVMFIHVGKRFSMGDIFRDMLEQIKESRSSIDRDLKSLKTEL